MADDLSHIYPDRPLLSPRRLWFAAMVWAHMARNGEVLPFWFILRYYRRPHAQDAAKGKK